MTPTPAPPPSDRDARGAATTAVVTAIVAVAPDVADDIDALDPDADLFEEFGLDSMDRLNIMEALAEATGVEIPERRLSSLVSMNQLVTHLLAASG